jgi:type VI secretion system secreted protein Hcp
MPITAPGSANGDAVADIYLFLQAKKAGTIKGNATAADHVDDMKVLSWHWGLTASESLGKEQGGSRHSYTALTVVRRLDMASVVLMSTLITNDEIKKARLAMRRPTGVQDDFFSITLEGARITSLRHDTHPDSDTLETLTLSFHKVTVEFEPHSNSGLRTGSLTFEDELPEAS